MNLLSDIITYIRRIIKTPSNAAITDDLLIDYINRFWIMDVDARIQLFDLKTKYSFQTTPAVDQYNMPLYDVQSEGGQTVGMFPVYQGFTSPAYINGVQVFLQTQKDPFFKVWPNYVQNLQQVAVGDGGTTYSFTLPILPASTPPSPPINGILRGHIDIAGIIATGTNEDPPLANNPTAITLIPQIPVTSVFPAFYLTTQAADGSNMVVSDSGIFLEGNINHGLLMSPGKAPYGNAPLAGYSTTNNTVNYLTGEVNVTFPAAVADGVNINAQCYFFQGGLPRSILFYNNVLTLRSPPAMQYLVELDAYLSPAAFFNTAAAIPFGYMAEYIARGAARKILSDVGDVEQFNFYEPLFIEQEQLVWKRSQRVWTSTRTETIFSQGLNQGQGNTNYAGGVS